MNIKKKLMIGLSTMGILAGVLTGCGNNVEQSTTNEKKQTMTETVELDSAKNKPKIIEGGTVRVAMSTEPDNLDPYLSAATDTNSIMDNVFDGLFEPNEKGELIFAIAESYIVSEDGLTYTFKLKEGITFHDGSDLTSEDVEYSYAKLAGLNGKEPLSSKLAAIQSIETPDEYTVILTLKENDAAFLAANIAAIVPSDYELQSEAPIGAGPFKFVEYKVGQEVVLEKNEEFYDEEHAPKIDRAEFKILGDTNAAVLALQAGDIDMVPGITDQGVLQLGENYNYVKGPQNMVQLMALNNEVEPLNNVKVRQAINFAIDKDMIIETVSEGNGTKLGSNMSPAMNVFYEAGLEEVYATNIDKAKELLKEAGLEAGFELTIRVPSNYKFHVDTAQVIAEQLKAIGVMVKIDQIEWSTWLEDVYTNANYEATIIGLTGKLDPHEVLGRYETNYARNFFNFSNSEFDEIIADARIEIDPTKRANMYKESQKILTEQAAAVFIMDPDRTVAMKKNLHGLKMYPVQKYNMAELYYTEE